MSATSSSSLDLLASGGRGKSSRTLLRVVILLFIAGAAIASRLFSVIRKFTLMIVFLDLGGSQLMDSVVLFDLSIAYSLYERNAVSAC
jgi:hypothetical protein